MADVKHTQWPQLGEMTVEQMNAWGAAEHAARMQDLTDRTPEGLARAQANAEARRKAIGASRSAAATMVSDASRARRRAAGCNRFGLPLDRAFVHHVTKLADG